MQDLSFDAPFIGPVPTIQLAAIKPENIPHAADLLRYMEESDSTADAFVRWAEERIVQADRRECLAGYDVTQLDSARVHLVDVLAQGGEHCVVRAALLDTVQVFSDAGLTFRQTASFCAVPVRTIVMLHLTAAAGERAERIADLEDAIVDGALERESQRVLLARVGMPGAFHLLANLRQLHAASHSEDGVHAA